MLVRPCVPLRRRRTRHAPFAAVGIVHAYRGVAADLSAVSWHIDRPSVVRARPPRGELAVSARNAHTRLNRQVPSARGVRVDRPGDHNAWCTHRIRCVPERCDDFDELYGLRDDAESSTASSNGCSSPTGPPPSDGDVRSTPRPPGRFSTTPAPRDPTERQRTGPRPMVKLFPDRPAQPVPTLPHPRTA